MPLFRRKVSTKHGVSEPRVDLDPDTGTARLVAPGTPWQDLDLSDSFLAALHTGEFEPKKSFWRKRRLFFIIGGLLGIFSG